MISLGKQCLDPMHTFAQSQFLTGGAITHMNVVFVLGDRLSCRRQININDQVMMSFTWVDAVFSRLNSISGSRHAHFNRIADGVRRTRLGDCYTLTGRRPCRTAAAVIVVRMASATRAASTTNKKYTQSQ